MKKLLISACLLGENCRYDGASVPLAGETIAALKEKYILIPVCPEQLGGLSTPRSPAEIVGEKVINRNGIDVTKQYESGAEIALCTAQENGCEAALLKEKSPSCGSGLIYDGFFSGKLISGKGKTAARLSGQIPIYSEMQVHELLKKAD